MLNEDAENADYTNPQELRVMQITTTGRDAFRWFAVYGYADHSPHGAEPMACSGCARRRAKLKKLLDLANERFEELKQRITGAADPKAHRDGSGGEDHSEHHTPGRIDGT